MKAVRDLDRPANRRCYTVAGRFVFVDSDESVLSGLLEQLFAGWLLARVESTNQRPDVLISCRCTRQPPEVPFGLDEFEIAEQARCYPVKEGFYLDLGNSLLQLSSSAPVKIEIWFRQIPETVNASLARAVSFAVCAGLRRHGVFDVHGAGVLAPGSSSGVLIIGPSGSGKSTLTTQLVAAGWGYLSDDEILLSIEDDQVLARGFRSFFALSTDAMIATGLAELEGAAAIQPAALKACFEPRSIFASEQAHTAAARFLFFTSVAHKAQTHLTELTKTESMIRLLRACPWATYDRDIAADNLQVLSRLAHQCRSFDLEAGSDLLVPRCADLLFRPYIESP
ncbi:MAG: hypothetical protein C5B55_03375 [Blastocatellia bacterium]|nr:MAG: hypothetical protein C5B55_03375 [Blastocatellia bacterium]